jgi:hypothetical protein
MLRRLRSNGPEWLIVVEASMGGTNYTFRVCLVGRSNSEILLPAKICLFVSPVCFFGHCPPHTDTASQPCPLEKLKSSFSIELGWLHPAKRLGRPATGPRALAPRARTSPEQKIPPRTLVSLSLATPLATRAVAVLARSPCSSSPSTSPTPSSSRSQHRRHSRLLAPPSAAFSSLARSRDSPVPPSSKPLPASSRGGGLVLRRRPSRSITARG